METTKRPMPTTLSGYGPDDGVVKAAASVHGAVDQVAATAEEAAGAVKPAIARVAQAAHQSVDKVVDLAQPTADWLAKQSRNVASTTKNAVEDGRVYVSTHPWQSVGVALALGYLIGRRSR